MRVDLDENDVSQTGRYGFVGNTLRSITEMGITKLRESNLHKNTTFNTSIRANCPINILNK